MANNIFLLALKLRKDIAGGARLETISECDDLSHYNDTRLKGPTNFFVVVILNVTRGGCETRRLASQLIIFLNYEQGRPRGILCTQPAVAPARSGFRVSSSARVAVH